MTGSVIKDLGLSFSGRIHALLVLSIFVLISSSDSFVLKCNSLRSKCRKTTFLFDSQSYDDPTKEWSDERKASLFQFLLRDLQVEGVPLLGVDADQVHTLQAALWTTLAELSEQETDQKACLIFEDIPIPALRTFVDDFTILKTQERMMQNLPELKRFSISLVGKGVGPAILIESGNKTDSILNPEEFNSAKYNAAMKMFVDRMIVGSSACPYMQSTDKGPEGLKDVIPGPIGYRSCGFSEVCHILSSFWNCICEILGTPSNDLSVTILSMPNIGNNHARFAAVSELISRSLCLYRGDDVLELMHFHPEYNRDAINPINKPAHGHLPPLSWIPSMMEYNGQDVNGVSEEDLQLLNYQRRSPIPAVCIKRAEQMDAGMDSVISLNLPDGSVEKASGISTYCRNAMKMIELGEEYLQNSLQNEIEVTR